MSQLFRNFEFSPVDKKTSSSKDEYNLFMDGSLPLIISSHKAEGRI